VDRSDRLSGRFLAGIARDEQSRQIPIRVRNNGTESNLVIELGESIVMIGLVATIPAVAKWSD
jgi:hypothetical protein